MEGCNTPSGELNNNLGQDECQARFLDALNRCNKENSIEEKYSNYPMI
jgi:hypothetical protein